MTYSANAIILRRQDVREWDRLYTVYTREHGKLMLVGKGTRRPRAKLAAHCEPFVEAEMEIARGRQIDRVVFARSVRTNDVFATSHLQLTRASFCCECVYVLTKDAHPDPELYELLRDTLGIFRAEPHIHSSADQLITPFLLRLLSVLGYASVLDRCVECRRVVPNGRSAIGVPWRGGTMCTTCASRTRGGKAYHEAKQQDDAIVLTAIDRATLAECAARLHPRDVTPSVEAFARALLAAHLPYPLRTVLTVPAAEDTVTSS